MSASGGSTSDQNISTNKVVDGQSHYLAYITPDEGKSLMDQGGKEVITDSGIPAYPTHHGSFGTSAGVSQGTSSGGGEGPPGGGDQGMTYDSRPPQLGGSGTVEQAEQLQRQTTATQETQEDNLITQWKDKIIDTPTVIKSALRLGLGNSKKLANALGITSLFSLAMGASGEVQAKAINWDLNRKLNKTFKEVEKGTHPGALGYKISDLQDKMERSQLDPSDPRHYGQDEYLKDYPGQDPASDRGQGDNARGLTNIITPYAAHAIGGTTPVTSQAAQWYANLGSGNSNPGAFNLTQQYAAAKAAVSQKLQSTSSVGQIAVADSAFFNFLKDNSLNKGIL